MAWPRRFAFVALVATALLLAVCVPLVMVVKSAAAVEILVLGAVVAPPSAVLGWLIARRHPGNIVGFLLTFFAFTVAATTAKELGFLHLADHPEPRLTPIVAALNESAWWIFAAVGLLLLHFPDGRALWRPIGPALIALTAFQQIGGAFEPIIAPLQQLGRPYTNPGWLDPIGLTAFVVLLGLLAAAVVAPLIRYRRGDARLRAQIKWLGLLGLGVPLYPLLCLAEIGIFGHPFVISQAAVVLGALGIPVATAIAIVRHDLYDVDKAVAGTVTWGVLTAVLLGAYAGTSFLAALVLGRSSSVVQAGAAVACALALAPLRASLQRRVDRRLYPLRRAAFAAIDELHRRSSAGHARPEELQQVLRTALRDPGLRVGYQLPGAQDFMDAEGHALASVGGVPVVLSDVPIGLLLAGRGPGSPALLHQVADRAAMLVEVVRLRLELARALQEAHSSRTRLVQAGYAERHALERDLHDGAQQRLVSLGMAIRLAQRHLDDGTVDVGGLLDQTVAELGTAVAELRHIAHGLRPSSLNDGLSVALRSLVSAVPLIVDLQVCSDPLPDDVATTAYFVASEAVANTMKHSGAARLELRVSQHDGQVLIRITDDGRGGAALSPRSSLADRVAALGGSLRVDSPAGRGTTVEAALPCAS